MKTLICEKDPYYISMYENLFSLIGSEYEITNTKNAFISKLDPSLSIIIFDIDNLGDDGIFIAEGLYEASCINKTIGVYLNRKDYSKFLFDRNFVKNSDLKKNILNYIEKIN